MPPSGSDKNLLQEEGRTEGMLRLGGQNDPYDITVSRRVKTWPGNAQGCSLF